jgi:hypothetical protein
MHLYEMRSGETSFTIRLLIISQYILYSIELHILYIVLYFSMFMFFVLLYCF